MYNVHVHLLTQSHFIWLYDYHYRLWLVNWIINVRAYRYHVFPIYRRPNYKVNKIDLYVAIDALQNLMNPFKLDLSFVFL